MTEYLRYSFAEVLEARNSGGQNALDLALALNDHHAKAAQAAAQADGDDAADDTVALQQGQLELSNRVLEVLSEALGEEEADEDAYD